MTPPLILALVSGTGSLNPIALTIADSAAAAQVDRLLGAAAVTVSRAFYHGADNQRHNVQSGMGVGLSNDPARGV